MFLHKSHIWENPGSRDMGDNVLSQSNSLIFCMLMQIQIINQKLIKKCLGVTSLVTGLLKLTVIQE